MKQLTVKSFGPVKDLVIELKAVNIFFGEQSIGKSTVAKLITILTDYYCLNTVIIKKTEGWKQQLKAYDIDEYDHGKYSVIYEFEQDNVKLRLNIESGKVVSSLQKDGITITNKSAITKELSRLRPIFHEELFFNKLKETLSDVEKKDTKEVLTSLERLACNSLYIPAERIVFSLFNKLFPALALVKESVPQYLLRFALDLINAKSISKRFDARLLNITYLHTNPNDYFIDGNSRRKYLLSQASSGIQSTLPLLLVVEYTLNHREYSSYVIEEPETNLFPEKQVDLLRYLLRNVNKEGRTITITTHSPYLLSALNNSLFAGSLFNRYGVAIDLRGKPFAVPSRS